MCSVACELHLPANPPNSHLHLHLHLHPPQAYDLILYGDSLTEAWRGTDHCQPCTRPGLERTGCDGLPALFNSTYGRRYRAAALGIAGDRVANLMWRMENGQLPASHQVRSRQRSAGPVRQQAGQDARREKPRQAGGALLGRQ